MLAFQLEHSPLDSSNRTCQKLNTLERRLRVETVSGADLLDLLETVQKCVRLNKSKIYFSPTVGIDISTLVVFYNYHALLTAI